MIKQDAQLYIREIPLECLQVKEFQHRYVDRVKHYVAMLDAHPDDYAGLIHVVPSDTHEGMFCVLDGHHRYCAYILAGRACALCVVIEE